MIRYGKSNLEYIRLKSLFYDLGDNARWVARAKDACAKYREQPARTACVACEQPLGEALFSLHEVPYHLCARCGHLSGGYEDTVALAEYLYESAGAADTASVYGDADREAFLARVDEVYRPKVDFMVDGLREAGADPAALSYLDIGAGAGHFVAAMRAAGLERSTGVEPSGALVEAANALAGTAILEQRDITAADRIAAEADADVVTMIFSLEHVLGLRRFLAALRANPRPRYLYAPVPVFNPSVLLEAVFPQVMPRILGLGHTHLFSDRSLGWLEQEFGMRRIAQWWFGGNAFDLFRTVSVELERGAGSRAAAEAWREMLLPAVDALQLAFDRRHLSSEVHVLFALER